MRKVTVLSLVDGHNVRVLSCQYHTAYCVAVTLVHRQQHSFGQSQFQARYNSEWVEPWWGLSGGARNSSFPSGTKVPAAER
jgi:hypothetical protein